MPRAMRLVTDEAGATSVEYAIMAGLIAVAIAVAVQTLGTNLIPIFTNAASGIGS
jgi:pilus assembly protein Flp/PilA